MSAYFSVGLVFGFGFEIPLAPNPDMSQFMSEGENLRGLGVTTIDKHQRCQVIADRKSTKFLDRECAARIVPDHPTAHNEDTEKFCSLDKRNKKALPSAAFVPQFFINAKPVSHVSRDGADIITSSKASDEWQFVSFTLFLKFSVPALAQQCITNYIEEL